MDNDITTPKDKRRDSYLKRTYGLSLADYDAIIESQGGGCAICLKTSEEDGRALAVDHVHVGQEKGRVRGALCWKCNKFLVGRHRKDAGSIPLLRAAADYLDREYHPFTAPDKPRKKRARTKSSKAGTKGKAKG